ncbi:MAG: endonuclease/exonuclease/phosphatase family protein [Planctomycetota bacterium]
MDREESSGATQASLLQNTRSSGTVTCFLALAFGFLTPCLGEAQVGAAEQQETVRFATFNVSLYGQNHSEVASRLASRGDPQISAVAEIIRHVRPDVLLLNEFDFPSVATGPVEPTAESRLQLLKLFQQNYLETPQTDGDPTAKASEPIRFAHRFTAPVNTGVHSGFDLDRNGSTDPNPGSADYSGDCWGYGAYPGQYGMAVLSRYPIDYQGIRTFQQFLWKDMPGAKLPNDPAGAEAAGWYSKEALAGFRLSSKSHWDVPIVIGSRRLHLLASHPTPPVFDGPEDRNGRRNHDEIRLWADYLSGGETAAYLYDDQGRRGGLDPETLFLVAGDLNCDPVDGEGGAAIQQLLKHPKIEPLPVPASAGAAEQARLQGGANAGHAGSHSHDTCDPPDADGPGNLRLDYVLPSQGLRIKGSGVFWPESADPLFGLVGTHPFPSSDHRLVWIDVIMGARSSITAASQKSADH